MLYDVTENFIDFSGPKLFSSSMNTCPWSSHAPSTLTFCEADLCAWVVHPAEAWSSFLISAFGIYIIYDAKKKGLPMLWLFGLAGILVGLFSFAFHATMTFWGEILDLGSMYLVVSLAIAFNSKRYFPRMSKKVFTLMYVGMSLGCLALLAIHKPMGSTIFALFIIFGVGMEVYMKNKLRSEYQVDYKYLKLCLGTLLFAWGIWWLDILKIVCDPDNHIWTGHSTWHLLNGVSIYFLYKLYQQLPEMLQALKDDRPLPEN